MRTGPGGDGLDAKGAVVVLMDNINLTTTSYLSSPPAPAVGDPMHYDAFIQKMCAEYRARIA